MSFEAIANAVRGRFRSQVQQTHAGGLVTVYDNTFAVDADGDRVPDPTGFHTRVHVLFADSHQASTGSPGNRTWRRVGVLQVDALQPLEQGLGPVHDLVDEIETAFGGVTAAGVVYLRVDPRPGRRDGQFWHVPIDVPFRADEVR